MNELNNTFDTPISKVTLKEDGVCEMNITVNEFTMDRLKEHYSILEDKFGDSKFHWIYSFSDFNIRALTHEARSYNNIMLKKHTLSLAAITPNPMIRIFVNLYIRISSFAFPIKTVADENAAKAWLSQYEGAELSVSA